jgi:hypothetical protein
LTRSWVKYNLDVSRGKRYGCGAESGLCGGIGRLNITVITLDTAPPDCGENALSIDYKTGGRYVEKNSLSISHLYIQPLPEPSFIGCLHCGDCHQP